MKVNKNTGEVIFCSDSGSRDFTPIEWMYSEDDKCFVPVLGKKVDIYAMIQLHKDSTDLQNIIARAKAGDISALNVRTGVYMDVTEAPKSLNDLAAFQNRINDSWNTLDPKVKDIWDGDLNKFATALMNNEIDKSIKAYYEKNSVVKDKDKEVSE